MPRKKTAISIIGLGYVGLSTAICLASSGFTVHGVEVIPEKIKAIESGKLPFEERGLDTMLKKVIKKNLLQVSSDYGDAIQSSSVTFITVGTPSRDDGSIDLKYVKNASEEIGTELVKKKGYHLVAEKSTVVPGTTQSIVKQALEERSGKKAFDEFGLCVNPEFLRESSAIYDTLHPDAIVVGSQDRKSKESLLSLYRAFYKKMPTIISTSLSNAELIKYSVNTFRATQLSFLNSLANLCGKTTGADSEEVISGLSMITRIDRRYLKAGLGYGGSCLPKDVRALIAHSRELGLNPALLEATQEVNETQPLTALKMAESLVGTVQGKDISVLGLAYKAGTDDARESVAIRLVNALAAAGAVVTVYDPQAMKNARKYLDGKVKFAQDAISCIRGSECCIIATDWEEFKKMKPLQFKNEMKNPAIVDGRRIFNSEMMRTEGVKYASIGRYEG